MADDVLLEVRNLRKYFPVKGVKINRRKIRKNPWTAVGQRGERMCFDVKKGRPSGAVAEACREEAARAGGCAPFSPLCLRSGRRCFPGRAKVCFPAGRGGKKLLGGEGDDRPPQRPERHPL